VKAPIRTIAHPTDFSELSGLAFAHALRIAVASRSKLHLLHVLPHDAGQGLAFPQVRRLLVQWGLAEEADTPGELARNLGIEIDTTRIMGQEPAQGLLAFLREEPCDLMVLATHGGGGFEHWLKGSVSEIVSRHAAIPTLFIAPGARGFVSQITGDIGLRRALVPVDFSPPPERAIDATRRISAILTPERLALHLLHIGSSAPTVPARAPDHALPPVMLRQGTVATTIVDVAIEFDVDLIGMATAGHRNLFDVLRGSTTERVIRHAPCPVLAVPAA
jgi:nucleotide-binding universal stress UspA family protein